MNRPPPYRPSRASDVAWGTLGVLVILIIGSAVAFGWFLRLSGAR